MKKILVTGACGYKGSVLVPKLLSEGYEVTALDLMWFGNHLEQHPKLSVLKADINDPNSFEVHGHDAIIHLASIANDPTGDLNPKLTWETSCLATMRLADIASRANVRHFIYASSGSVYGVKTETNVTEELPLVPISEYNKTKMVSERALLSYSDKMIVQIIRPATVCGLSPRMRFDVSVNLLTLSALQNGKITVFGGNQVRPNIHIDDIVDLYLFLLSRPNINGVFNAGFENLSILEIAGMIQEKIDVPIEVTPSSDPRSYRVDSSKLLNFGFKPHKTVAIAIDEIVEAYRSGKIKDEPHFHNLNWMTSNKLVEM